jgi:hypothetical protein
VRERERVIKVRFGLGWIDCTRVSQCDAILMYIDRMVHAFGGGQGANYAAGRSDG